MKSGLRRRFYSESVLSAISLVMLVVTVVRRDWIEMLFSIDPDQGTGAAEWMIAGSLLVATLALMMLARAEWRRARVAAA
ncbi:MAG TPA: hypothetical protein VKQ30_13490 [Ktedonobacterales bacterium]|nr:hypothetical protein [Ktedonobacterales bacterium]